MLQYRLRLHRKPRVHHRTQADSPLQDQISAREFKMLPLYCLTWLTILTSSVGAAPTAPSYMDVKGRDLSESDLAKRVARPSSNPSSSIRDSIDRRHPDDNTTLPPPIIIISPPSPPPPETTKSRNRVARRVTDDSLSGGPQKNTPSWKLDREAYVSRMVELWGLGGKGQLERGEEAWRRRARVAL
jgi:hypothetical protein